MRISPVKIRKDKNEGTPMLEEIKNQGKDDLTQSLTIELPCQIFERVQRYANENGMDAAVVLIEALDEFLRKQG
jgi:hypothetical protein